MATSANLNDDDFAASLAEFEDRLRSNGLHTAAVGENAFSCEGVDARLGRARRCLLLLELTRPGDDDPNDGTAHDAESPESSTVLDEGGVGVAIDSLAHSGDLPQRIDRFEIVDVLGRGGFGVVYLAHDPVVDRLVALKLPHATAGLSKDARQRFLREAKLTAALNHRNIATLLQTGVAGEKLWIATEFCDGIVLADLIANSPHGIPAVQAADIVARLADGVAHAHARGILHRDIKPGNVVLVPTEPLPCSEPLGPSHFERGEPKLLDFGLSKDLFDESAVTRSRAILGTPAYMAPERLIGTNKTVDHRADIYALGVLLFELLTGVPPFRGDTPAVLRQAIEVEAPSPRRFVANVPVDLAAICLKCLEKRPHHRFSTAAELAEDLRRCLAGMPTKARPTGVFGKVMKWTRRRPAWAATFLLTTLAVVSVPVAVDWHLNRLDAEQVTNEKLRTEAAQREQQWRRDQYRLDIQSAGRLWNDGRIHEAQAVLEKHIPNSDGEDLRDLGWRLLWHQCGGERTVYAGHVGAVVAVAVSPDGRLTATGGQDNTIRLCDTETASLKNILKGHRTRINALAFTPDGAKLIAAADAGELIVWEIATGAVASRLKGHVRDVLCVAVSSDGKVIASGGMDETIRLWRIADGTISSEFSGHAGGVRGLAFRPDSKEIASVGTDRMVKVRKVPTATVIWENNWHRDIVTACAYSPDGTMLATAGKNRDLTIWNASTGERLCSDLGHDARVRAIAWSDDGRHLIAAGAGNDIAFWRVDFPKPPKLVREIIGHAHETWAIAAVPGSNSIVTASSDGTAKLWEVREDLFCEQFLTLPGSLSNEAIASHNDILALGLNHSVRFWNLREQREIRCIDRERTFAKALAIAPDGKWLAVAGDLPYVPAYAIDDPKTERRIAPGPSIRNRVAFDRSGTWLAAGDESGFVDCCQWPSGDVDRRWQVGNIVYQVEFSPVDNQLAVRIPDDGGQIVFYSIGDWTEQRRLRDCRGAMAFSSDGKLIAVPGRDHTIAVHNVADGSLNRRLGGHGALVESLVFSPDDKSLLSAPVQGPVKMWDVASGDELFEIRRRDDRSGCLWFTQDGRRLVIGDNIRENKRLKQPGASLVSILPVD